MPLWACPALELTARGALRPCTGPNGHVHGLATSPRAGGRRAKSREAVSGACRRRPVAYPDTGRRAAVSRGARVVARRPARRGQRYTSVLCNSVPDRGPTTLLYLITVWATAPSSTKKRAGKREPGRVTTSNPSSSRKRTGASPWSCMHQPQSRKGARADLQHQALNISSCFCCFF